jgi:hypothetical protein
MNIYFITAILIALFILFVIFLFIRSERDWDDLFPFIVLSVGGSAIIFVVSLVFYEAYMWTLVPQFECPATLINDQYHPSTLQSHMAPTMGSSGRMSTTFYTTGSSESYITVWDCGKYGRLRSDNEKVYRWAQPESVLYLKQLDDDVRIVGIKH